MGIGLMKGVGVGAGPAGGSAGKFSGDDADSKGAKVATVSIPTCASARTDSAGVDAELAFITI